MMTALSLPVSEGPSPAGSPALGKAVLAAAPPGEGEDFLKFMGRAGTAGGEVSAHAATLLADGRIVAGAPVAAGRTQPGTLAAGNSPAGQIQTAPTKREASAHWIDTSVPSLRLALRTTPAKTPAVRVESSQKGPEGETEIKISARPESKPVKDVCAQSGGSDSTPAARSSVATPSVKSISCNKSNGGANQVLRMKNQSWVGTVGPAVRGRLGEATLPKPNLRPSNGAAVPPGILTPSPLRFPEEVRRANAFTTPLPGEGKAQEFPAASENEGKAAASATIRSGPEIWPGGQSGVSRGQSDTPTKSAPGGGESVSSPVVTDKSGDNRAAPSNAGLAATPVERGVGMTAPAFAAGPALPPANQVKFVKKEAGVETAVTGELRTQGGAVEAVGARKGGNANPTAATPDGGEDEPVSLHESNFDKSVGGRPTEAGETPAVPRNQNDATNSEATAPVEGGAARSLAEADPLTVNQNKTVAADLAEDFMADQSSDASPPAGSEGDGSTRVTVKSDGDGRDGTSLSSGEDVSAGGGWVAAAGVALAEAPAVPPRTEVGQDGLPDDGYPAGAVDAGEAQGMPPSTGTKLAVKATAAATDLKVVAPENVAFIAGNGGHDNLSIPNVIIHSGEDLPLEAQAVSRLRPAANPAEASKGAVAASAKIPFFNNSIIQSPPAGSEAAHPGEPVSAKAAEPSNRPPVEASGMTVATNEARMKSAAKVNEFAGSAVQELPLAGQIAPALGGTRSGSAASPGGVPIQIDFRTDKDSSAQWMLADMSPAGATRLSLSANPASRVAVATTSLADVERLINREVTMVRQSGAQALAVTLKVDARTSLFLQLTNHGGQIEASVRCEKGGAEGLAAHWGELQEALAGQNVQLLPLQANAPEQPKLPTESAGDILDNASSQGQPQPQPSPAPAEEPEPPPTDEAMNAAVGLAKSKNRSHARRGWEKWA